MMWHYERVPILLIRQYPSKHFLGKSVTKIIICMNHVKYIYNVIYMIVSRILVFLLAYAISRERLLVSGSIVLWLKTETATWGLGGSERSW